ncbi:MAG: hypothetical protein NTW19_18290 [Planctomycetota bacterium]|nr:hypothetical protein [Planctomycetota bacterium]
MADRGKKAQAWRLARMALLIGGPCALMSLPLPVPPWREGASPRDIALFALLAATLLAWVAFLAPGRSHDDRWARHRPWLWWGMLALASTIITWSLVGENVHTQWRVIDDHDYVALIGPTGHMTAPQWLRALANAPEIASPTWGIARYRPVFWIWRITEMYLWGAVPERFWIAKVCMFGVALALGWWALWVWLGGLGAGIVLAWLVAPGYWVDVWSRLGCSEAHGALGAAMLGAGAALIALEVRRAGPLRSRPWATGWALAAAGVVIAAGSKENFLGLTPIVWFLMFWAGRRRTHGQPRKLGLPGWAAGAVVTLLSLWIAAVILTGVLTRKTDFYENPVSTAQRLRVIALWINSDTGRLWTAVAVAGLLLAAGAWALSARAPGRFPGRRYLRDLRPPALLFALFAALVATQLVFYNGKFPTAIRYDFPGVAAAMLAAVALAQLVLALWRVASVDPRPPAFARAAALALVGLAALSLGFAPLRHGGAMNVAESHAFTNLVTRAAQRVNASPSRPLVFVAHHPDDAELAISILRFLRFKGVLNAAYLATRFPPESLADPLARRQAELLRHNAAEGDGGFNKFSEYVPAREPMVYVVLLDFDGNAAGLAEAGLDMQRQRLEVVFQLNRAGQMPVTR